MGKKKDRVARAEKALKQARKKAAKAEKALAKAKAEAEDTNKPCLPKPECCVSKDRCRRCPIRMLKEGTLPEGMTVKKRVLVTSDGKKVTKKDLQKVA